MLTPCIRAWTHAPNEERRAFDITSESMRRSSWFLSSSTFVSIMFMHDCLCTSPVKNDRISPSEPSFSTSACLTDAICCRCVHFAFPRDRGDKFAIAATTLLAELLSNPGDGSASPPDTLGRRDCTSPVMLGRRLGVLPCESTQWAALVLGRRGGVALCGGVIAGDVPGLS